MCVAIAIATLSLGAIIGAVALVIVSASCGREG
jgi:hypothetical protein